MIFDLIDCFILIFLKNDMYNEYFLCESVK